MNNDNSQWCKGVHKDIKPEDFKNLSPIQDIDISGYKEALDHAFSDDSIRNIAITGSYGSGKSSILNAYKKTSKLKFLNISFLHFGYEDKKDSDSPKKEEGSNSIEELKDKDDEGKISNYIVNQVPLNINQNKDGNPINSGKSDDKGKKKEEILERKIINHLINQIPYRYIKNTNFNIRGKLGRRYVLSRLIATLVFIISVLYIINFYKPSEVLNNVFNNLNKVGLLVSLSLLYIIGYLSVWLGTRYGRLIMNKATYKHKNIEIDVGTAKNNNCDSFFDVYLNEVLYAFENCQADVVVFEDIDRFEMRIIFERLREINILLNARLERKRNINRFFDKIRVRKQKIIRFCYVMRDDLFDVEDRCKMFDLMIPVIPVMNGFNSYSVFLKYFGNYFGNNISSSDYAFIFNVSAYITNMRLINNIYNEFIIYNRRSDGVIGVKNILAMIIYKNLFSRDFNDLNHSRGFLFNIFKGESQVRSILKDDFENKVKDHKEAYSRQVNKIIEDIKDKSGYICYDYDIDNFVVSWLLREKKDLLYSQLRSYIETCYGSQITYYYEKMIAYSEYIPKNILDLKFFILENTYYIRCLEGEQFKDIYSELNLKIFNLAIELFGIDGNLELVKYLIFNGFINECCLEYVLNLPTDSDRDRRFILKVFNYKDHQYDNLGYDYKLDNPELIIQKLNLLYFSRIWILNFDLLDKLVELSNPLQDKSNYDSSIINKLSSMVNQLNNTDNFDFIVNYFEKNKGSDKWDNFIEKLSSNNVMFNKIRDDIDDELVNQILQNNLYEINRDNFIKAIKSIGNLHVGYEVIQCRNYSLICSDIKYNKINEHIHKTSDNLYKYLTVYINGILNNVTEILDEEVYVISLIENLFGILCLNSYDKSRFFLVAYLEKLKTKIRSISCINLSLLEITDQKVYIYQELLRHKVALLSVANIYEYYVHIKEIDDVMVDFINNNNDKLVLGYSYVNNIKGKDIIPLLEDLIKEDRINENRKIEIQSCIDELK